MITRQIRLPIKALIEKAYLNQRKKIVKKGKPTHWLKKSFKSGQNTWKFNAWLKADKFQNIIKKKKFVKKLLIQ